MAPTADLGTIWLQLQRAESQRAKCGRYRAGGSGTKASTGDGLNDGPSKPQVPALSQLVHNVLGQQLDKSMRMSNWTRRPLVAPQVVYAVLDAHCLIRIFECWERQALIDRCIVQRRCSRRVEVDNSAECESYSESATPNR